MGVVILLHLLRVVVGYQQNVIWLQRDVLRFAVHNVAQRIESPAADPRHLPDIGRLSLNT